MFGFRKSAAVQNSEDRELIEANSKAMEALIVLAADNAAVKDELSDIKETLKYLVPSIESKVVDWDKKIKNIIGDLRIVLNKADGEETKKVARYISDLKLAIADRNSHL